MKTIILFYVQIGHSNNILNITHIVYFAIFFESAIICEDLRFLGLKSELFVFVVDHFNYPTSPHLYIM